LQPWPPFGELELVVVPTDAADCADSVFWATPSVTLVTPLITRRRDISRATSSWLPVQPASSKAGAVMLPRSELAPPAPPPPPALAPGATVPTSDASEVLAGTTPARFASAACQSKRVAASSRTVSARVWAAWANVE